nr:putative ABC1 protein At2g40090 [Tanacetum cinerariifolium]
MLNRCPTSTYDQVCKVVKKELGGAPEEIFDEFDPVPIASASLAQVHVARTHEGQKVAVKVQHTHMTDTAAADLATVEMIVNTVHRFFPSFDYRWLVDEVKETSPKELDFLNEAKNSVKCMDNFRRLSPHIAAYIYAPTIYWSLSTSKLLTMEFIEAPQVNDLKSIKKLGIRPHDISKLVSQTFAEMMFKHGFVHCDPHVANLLVRALPSDRSRIFDHPKWKNVEISKFYKSKKSSSKKSRTSENTSQGNSNSAHIGVNLNDEAADSEDVEAQEYKREKAELALTSRCHLRSPLHSVHIQSVVG